MYPKMVILLVFVLCSFDLCSVSARSNGAPSMACQSLSPWHITWTGFVQSEQPKSSPFAVEAVIQPGNKRISVNIHPQKMKMNQTFRGFVVQARLVDKPEVIVDGIFVTDEGDDTQSFVCGRGHKQKLRRGQVYSELNLDCSNGLYSISHFPGDHCADTNHILGESILTTNSTAQQKQMTKCQWRRIVSHRY